MNLTEWLHDYVLYLLLMVGTVFTYFWLSHHKTRLQIANWHAAILAVLHTVIGVLCVKVFAFMEIGTMDGQSLYGAVFFMPVLYFAGAKLTKRKPVEVIDIFAVAMIFTLLCARVNCVISGCCEGLQIPWSESHRWPTRELEILFYIVVLLWLVRWGRKPENVGQIYPIYMIAYGTFRFVIEWFRESNIRLGYLHISHIWSIISIVIGVAIYIELQESIKEKSKRGKRK